MGWSRHIPLILLVSAFLVGIRLRDQSHHASSDLSAQDGQATLVPVAQTAPVLGQR
jgi:hypothetical protein